MRLLQCRFGFRLSRLRNLPLFIRLRFPLLGQLSRGVRSFSFLFRYSALCFGLFRLFVGYLSLFLRLVSLYFRRFQGFRRAGAGLFRLLPSRVSCQG